MIKTQRHANRIQAPLADRIFGTFLLLFVLLLVLVFAYPLYFVLVASFSDPGIVGTGAVLLYPKGFTLVGYQNILKNTRIWVGYRNTLLYVTSGTLVALVVTILAAYSLSRRDLPGRNAIMGIYVFTMYFNGGLIPTYLVVKNLGLVNNPLVIVLLGAFSVYNMIIARTYFATAIPLELQEAAAVDGCSTQRLFFSIVLPLSKPIIAVIALYVAVSHWNAYFNAMIYLNNRSLLPLTIFLKEILISGQIDTSTIADPELAEKSAQLAGVIKYALIVVSMLPVLAIYPFVQKHFVKGVTIGAIKG